MTENTYQEPGNSRGWARWKFVAGFLGMILGVFGIYMGFQVYRFYRQSKAVEELARDLERTEREAYERALADTYGGATPQETLRMYIEAVEAGDYELASKYFVEEKREESKKIFSGVSVAEIGNYVVALKDSINNNGSFSEEGNFYAIRHPGLIEFVRSPAGVWKIIEI